MNEDDYIKMRRLFIHGLNRLKRRINAECGCDNPYWLEGGQVEAHWKAIKCFDEHFWDICGELDKQTHGD
jgi:hypothetical protein